MDEKRIVTMTGQELINFNNALRGIKGSVGGKIFHTIKRKNRLRTDKIFAKMKAEIDPIIEATKPFKEAQGEIAKAKNEKTIKINEDYDKRMKDCEDKYKEDVKKERESDPDTINLEALEVLKKDSQEGLENLKEEKKEAIKKNTEEHQKLSEANEKKYEKENKADTDTNKAILTREYELEVLMVRYVLVPEEAGGDIIDGCSYMILDEE